MAALPLLRVLSLSLSSFFSLVSASSNDGHPRQGSMAPPHCLASYSRCGFPFPSSGLAGVACRGRGSQRTLRDACGMGVVAVLSLSSLIRWI
jgi:hypothetical protein